MCGDSSGLSSKYLGLTYLVLFKLIMLYTPVTMQVVIIASTDVLVFRPASCIMGAADGLCSCFKRRQSHAARIRILSASECYTACLCTSTVSRVLRAAQTGTDFRLTATCGPGNFCKHLLQPSPPTEAEGPAWSMHRTPALGATTMICDGMPGLCGRVCQEEHGQMPLTDVASKNRTLLNSEELTHKRAKLSRAPRGFSQTCALLSPPLTSVMSRWQHLTTTVRRSLRAELTSLCQPRPILPLLLHSLRWGQMPI